MKKLLLIILLTISPSYGFLTKLLDPNKTDQQIFHEAVQKGNMLKVKIYFNKDTVDINKSVNVAVANTKSKKHQEIAKFLIENGAKAGMYTAIENTNLVVMQMLIDRGYPVDSYVDTPIVPALKILLENGADVNYKERPGHDDIIVSAVDDYDRLKLLLEHGANANAIRKSYEYSLLMLAAENNNLESVKLLVEYGADVNYKRDDPYDIKRHSEPLYLAVSVTNLEMVKFLVENGAKTDGKDCAALQAYSDLDIIKYLVDNGALLNNHIDHYGTPLNSHVGNLVNALYNNKNDLKQAKISSPIVRYFLDKGADISKVYMPIMVYMVKHKKDFPEFAEYVANNMDKVNSFTNINDNSLLHMEYTARRYRRESNFDYIKFLIEEVGVDINIKDNINWTVLQWVTMDTYRNKDDFEIFGKYLVDNGADIHFKDEYGNSVLYFGDVEMVKYFVEKGVDINSRNIYGGTALMYSGLEIAKYLVSMGADTRGMTINNWAEIGYFDKVKECVENGVNINTKDEHGQTPLMHIVGYSNRNNDIVDIVKYLIENGANVNAVDNDGASVLQQLGISLVTYEYLKLHGAVEKPNQR